MTTLQKTGTTALANSIPEHLQKFVGDARGKENINKQDVRIPALKLAQSTSKETKRIEALYMEGLREGEMFLSVLKENLGEGPIGLIVVNPLGHRHVEFAPRGTEGGVIDGNVPDNDPRTKFTEELISGKLTRVKPKATKFIDFVVLVVREDGSAESATLSMKSTQLGKAVDMTTTLSRALMPPFCYLWKVTPAPEKRGDNNFYGWRIVADGYPTPELVVRAEAFYAEIADKTVKVEEETDEPVKDDIPF